MNLNDREKEVLTTAMKGVVGAMIVKWVVIIGVTRVLRKAAERAS